VTLSSRRRLEVNVTAAFVETAITTLSLWRRESDNVLRMNRGQNAPFRVHNRTGYPIRIWSETDDKTATPRSEYLADGDEIPWRFDDWRSMREVRQGKQFLITRPATDRHNSEHCLVEP
jgi:vacuolar protein sorting-associated protein 13A/C